MSRYDYILIDSMNLLHRAAHTYTLGFMNDEGDWIQTGPVFGFLSMSIAIWEKYAAPGCQLIFCWDAGYDHRLKIYPEYKANRRKKKAENQELEPEERTNLPSMQSALRKILYVAGFRQAISPGYEADDVLGTLGAQLDGKGKVGLYTWDQDLHQCVTDSVHVLSENRGVMKVWTPVEVEGKWGFPPNRVAEIKGLIGDGGDNIPGVPGCGLKWAQKLFHRYGDIRRIIAATGVGPKPVLKGEFQGKKWKTPSLTTKIAAAGDQIYMSWELAKVVKDAPVIMEHPEPDIKVFRQVLDSLRFNSLLEGRKWSSLEAIRG